jgi:alginate O-acetyltransferase complex protein AlgI
MVFSSLIFLFIFIPVNIILYFIFRNKIYRNIVLILFSLIFYAWGEPVWVCILLFTATTDYFHGRIIDKAKKRFWVRTAVFSSLAMNIGILVLFKYNSFLIENFNYIFNSDYNIPHYAFPIGISFYTFRSISYIIDVYRKDVKAEKYFHNYLMYLSLYPCLVAGPIVRYSEISEEIDSRKISIKDISEGISRFCLGLFKKVFFANIAGELAIKFLNGDLSQTSVVAAWFGIILFALQIYFDFSGYSDMALGLGRIFGFRFNENFNFPYISRSITEFWRRWHISLSSWLRDYIFLPFSLFLAHNFNKNKFLFLKTKHWVNIFSLILTFFICGLWHGPSWNYIIWGLYFAFFMIIESLFLSKILNYRYNFISHIYFLIIIIFGWVIFYFTDISEMVQFMKILIGYSGNQPIDLPTRISVSNNLYWLIFALIFCLPVKQFILNLFRTKTVSDSKAFLLIETFTNIGFLVISTSLLIGKSYMPFLYFQF